MAVHSLELESVPPARSRHSARWLLIAAVVIVALAVGSAGTIGYQYLRWLTGASATNAQAARISNELTAQLSAAVFAPGEATGHVRIEADLVNLVENSGGILLSFTTISAAGDNVADVMLGQRVTRSAATATRSLTPRPSSRPVSGARSAAPMASQGASKHRWASCSRSSQSSRSRTPAIR
jgi:hypothetical protein